MPNVLLNPNSPLIKTIIPHMVVRTKIPMTPQIRSFLLSLSSFSLPLALINLPTLSRKTNRATAPRKGMILSPMSVNSFITAFRSCGWGGMVCVYLLRAFMVPSMAVDITHAPRSMAAPITDQRRAS